ncbi:MAG: hypothetical protein CMO74_02840 [Verrucomicrobiales bacterium]|nr:hypothetical protein [Verrucomicrobiales bacterium]|tara:strand:- start:10400 stop:11449 length:1050 start_codon:yes stop_codon:yes gene_type:complete
MAGSPESGVGLLSLDRKGRVVSVDAAGARLLGRRAKGLLGKALGECLPGFRVPPDAALNELVLPSRGKRRAKRIGCHISEAVVGRRRVWLVALHDMEAARARVEEQEALAEQAVRRLGQELHDSVCQQLAGADLVCQALLRRLEGNGASDLAGQVRVMVKEGLTQARAISHGSTVDEDRTLADNLTQLVKSMTHGFPGGCRMFVQYVHEDLPRTLQTHVCRIAQEALHNAVKHGQARHALVKLFGSGKSIQMEVRDDGRGMDRRRREGLGLGSMRRRADLLKGDLRLDSERGTGTAVHLTVPLGGAAEDKPVRGRVTQVHLVIPTPDDEAAKAPVPQFFEDATEEDNIG